MPFFCVVGSQVIFQTFSARLGVLPMHHEHQDGGGKGPPGSKPIVRGVSAAARGGQWAKDAGQGLRKRAGGSQPQ